MSFVNQYINPDYTFNFAEEFAENNDRFLYAVGYSSKGPVVVKSTLDGQSVWEHVIAIQLETPGFRFYKLVQLRIKESFVYVITAYDGMRTVLLCIDASGSIKWTEELDTKVPYTKSFLVAASDQKSCFFAYTDKVSFNGIATPVVIQLNFFFLENGLL